MKNRLNITIDEVLIQEAKRYAFKKNTSLSSLIQDSLRTLVSRRPTNKQNVLDFVKTLPKPNVDTEHYSKETYYEDSKAKYGF
ncbi:MAG: DUF6364 family protein [Chitinophagaceae bacterium]